MRKWEKIFPKSQPFEDKTKLGFVNKNLGLQRKNSLKISNHHFQILEHFQSKKQTNKQTKPLQISLYI